MTFPSNIQSLIEQYLNGELQGQALLDFETQLKENEELVAEVAFQRDLQFFLAETPENELRKNLQALGDQVTEAPKEEERGFWWWLFPAGSGDLMDWIFGKPQWHLAWLIPLLMVIGWWWTSQRGIPISDDNLVGNDTAKTETVTPPLLPIDTTKVNPIVKEDKKAATDSTETKYPTLKLEVPVPKTIEEPYVNQPSPDPTPKKEKEELKSPIPDIEDLKVPERTVEMPTETLQTAPSLEPPIVYVPETMSSAPPPPQEYHIHPILHSLMNSTDFLFQNVGFYEEFILEKEDDEINFILEGQIQQKKRTAKKGLWFYLFSNEAAAYEAFEPIESVKLASQKIDKNRYQYELKQNFQLAPGRYYFVIRDHEGKDNLYIGSFVVDLNQ